MTRAAPCAHARRVTPVRVCVLAGVVVNNYEFCNKNKTRARHPRTLLHALVGAIDALYFFVGPGGAGVSLLPRPQAPASPRCTRAPRAFVVHDDSAPSRGRRGCCMAPCCAARAAAASCLHQQQTANANPFFASPLVGPTAQRAPPQRASPQQASTVPPPWHAPGQARTLREAGAGGA